MKKYRLKKEAVPFFKKEMSNKIEFLDSWTRREVDINALEEVEPIHVSYGIEESESASSLCAWSSGKGGKEYGEAKYKFTLNFPSISHKQHDEMSKGRHIRALMDKIQETVNCYFEEFTEDS